VDWSRTRAYALGLGGFYLNIRDREAHGILARGQETEQIEREIIEKLEALRDSDGRAPIRTVYATRLPLSRTLS